MALSSMVRYDTHHQAPYGLPKCKHLCIQVPGLLLGVLLWSFWLVARYKMLTSERHSGAILQIVKCKVDATSQPCYKGSPVTALHTALLYRCQTREPIRQMCLFTHNAYLHVRCTT